MIKIRKKHITVGMPMAQNQGFKEINIALAVSFAFREAGYHVFPEFPYKRGSIDAVFVHKKKVVVCEWKHIYGRAPRSIVAQTQRMLRFDPKREFMKHGFKAQPWKTKRLWICDTWQKSTVPWWTGDQTQARAKNPFARNRWVVGKENSQRAGSGEVSGWRYGQSI